MVKKTIQALESLNSDVRDKSWAQITILGQDEQDEKDTDANFELVPNYNFALLLEGHKREKLGCKEFSF